MTPDRAFAVALDRLAEANALPLVRTTPDATRVH